jgi:hypothetical protein
MLFASKKKTHFLSHYFQAPPPDKHDYIMLLMETEEANVSKKRFQEIIQLGTPLRMKRHENAQNTDNFLVIGRRYSS